MNDFGIDFEGELNPAQFSAVTAPYNRPALVLAGAGSGKTRTLTYRVAWFLAECSFAPREILLLTFTNKAAREMLDRIFSLTGFSPDAFWGGTFHSVGNRFLRREGRAIGVEPDFTILDSDDSEAFLKRCVEEEYPNFFSVKDNPRVKLLRDIISYARNTCKSVPQTMAERFSWLETPAEQIADIAKFYDFDKRRKNYCDFDDLLELWKRLLEEDDAVRARYAGRFGNILVDEYQDTNSLQCRILDLLADRGDLTAVGDDAQCIYSWRGAQIDNILHFKDRYPAASVFKIERNYRSTPQILDFANAVLSGMPTDDEYKKSLVAARGGASKPLVIRAMDASSQGRQVADCVLDAVSSGKYRYSDIAILYRSHFQAMDLQLQMQYKNIPFVMTSGMKFFEQAHIKDVAAMIRFAANPRDFMSFWRLLKYLPKVGEKTANKIFAAALERSQKKKISIFEAFSDKPVVAKVPAGARESFGELVSDISALREMFERSLSAAGGFGADSENGAGGENPPGVFQADLFFAGGAVSPGADSPSANRVSVGGSEKGEGSGSEPAGDSPARDSASAPGADSTAADNPLPKDFVKAACSGWYSAVMKTQYADWQERVDDFDALYEYAGRYANIGDFLDNIALETDARPESEADAKVSKVRLMTVHQAKGLEFPIVFIVGAADGLFPTKRSIEEGDVEEERRLFYVAATRAMDYLIISYPRVGASGGNFEMRPPSRFLESVDPALYDCAF